MIWLVGVVVWLAAALFAWSLCVVSGRADEDAGKMGEGR